MKKFSILIFLIATVLVGLGFGFYIGENQCKICQPEEINFSLFWEAYSQLQAKFSQKEKLDDQKIIYGAISGMVKSLKDPYTIFLNPEDTKRFIEDVKGTFEGVGMEVGIRESQLTVISPLENTPAQKAGLRPGDKIVKINDIITMDITIDEAVNLIRGPKGTKVILTIFRSDENISKDIEVERATIKVPSLKWEIKETPNKEKIIYLKIYQFSEKASLDFKGVVGEILESQSQKIILDLRNNPGGYLRVAQDIAGWFLRQGEIVVIEDYGKDKGEKEHKAEGPSTFLEYPMVILINQGSASGSEILAGCLRDNRGIKLIGQTSFGKGSVQQIEKLKGDSSLKITVANWLTPNRELITDIGLKPDIEIEITKDDYENDIDPQLDKALEIISEM